MLQGPEAQGALTAGAQDDNGGGKRGLSNTTTDLTLEGHLLRHREQPKPMGAAPKWTVPFEETVS